MAICRLEVECAGLERCDYFFVGFVFTLDLSEISRKENKKRAEHYSTTATMLLYVSVFPFCKTNPRSKSNSTVQRTWLSSPDSFVKLFFF